MSPAHDVASAQFHLAHQFGAREARDNWRHILDLAEDGVVSIVRRSTPVVIAPRNVVEDALAATHPFNVQVSVEPAQVGMWLDGVPVHGVGATYDEAEDDFLDALLDYAQAWVEELRYAPNHRANAGLVTQVLMFGGKRDELRDVVFGDK
jgi:hypothetical protein